VVKGAKEDASSLEGQDGKHLAERWGLPFREAHTLSIDPAALEIVNREESRRLRVLPLELGTEGPVFAVAEPSEERFAAVREIAGDNASFVVVAQATLDALLNSKVFSVSGAARKPLLFRARPDESQLDEELERVEERPGEPGADDRVEAHVNGHQSSDGADAASALDSLFTQIASGAGTLRAQVDQLTGSLEATQRELREAKEQLAEVNERLAEVTRASEGHDETVAGLEAEVERLRGELATATKLNESMTGRLEEVARALGQPSSGDGS
jgi:outer membrane murein-binding lipoprotein Lpp